MSVRVNVFGSGTLTFKIVLESGADKVSDFSEFRILGPSADGELQRSATRFRINI